AVSHSLFAFATLGPPLASDAHQGNERHVDHVREFRDCDDRVGLAAVHREPSRRREVQDGPDHESRAAESRTDEGVHRESGGRRALVSARAGLPGMGRVSVSLKARVAVFLSTCPSVVADGSWAVTANECAPSPTSPKIQWYVCPEKELGATLDEENSTPLGKVSLIQTVLAFPVFVLL